MAIPTSKEWIQQIFDAQQAQTGGIVRRAISDVDHNASFDELLGEVRNRSFHLVETGDQYVIFCHEGSIRIHC